MDLRRTVGTVAASVRPKWTARARMRPGYLIIGTKRGGSTSLAAWVSQHPQTAPCLSNKGTHFFDINYPRGPQWYFSRFEKPRDGWRTTGEASPYYMYHPAAPERIATTLPEVKLIAVLRDPVERAWSQYRYEVSRGNETETFERALDLEPERLRGGTRATAQRSDVSRQALPASRIPGAWTLRRTARTLLRPLLA